MKYETAPVVKKARAHKGITQKQLAERLPVHPNTLSGWEQGRHRPKLCDLTRIASICGVSITYTPGGSGSGTWDVHALDASSGRSGEVAE